MPAEPLPLTDDLWLAAHDTVNGKSRLTPRTLGIGLAAGLIAELLFWQNLVLERGKLYLLNSPAPPDGVHDLDVRAGRPEPRRLDRLPRRRRARRGAGGEPALAIRQRDPGAAPGPDR
jgi:hypothetical protein